MSPFESLSNASFPSFVMLHLCYAANQAGQSRASNKQGRNGMGTYPSLSMTCASLSSTWSSSSGLKRNLVHLLWIAGMILFT